MTLNPFKRRAQIRTILSTQVTLSTWTASPELVQYAQRLHASREFQTLLSCLRNESPANWPLPHGATHDDQIAHSYKAAGYNLALNNIEAMCELARTAKAIEATFEPEQKL